MSGKIERLVGARHSKVEKVKLEPPGRAVAATRSAAAQRTAFSSAAPPQAGTGPTGTHVAVSARPDALWGEGPARGRGPNMDPRQFDKLTPAQRKEKLTELRAQRDELQVKILERVIELDQKWNSAPTATKEEALRQYAENSEQLDPETAAELTQMLHQAEVAQRRIDRLRSRRDGMPPARHANAETKRQRAELNKELRAARKEQKAAVKEATAVVDEQGLKVDRLAVTEQVIDPSAPKKDSSTSLIGMVKDFFKFSWLSDFLMSSIYEADDRSSEKRVHEAALQREAASYESYVKEVGNKEALGKLAAAAELARR